MTANDLVARAFRYIPGGVSTNFRLSEGPDKLIVESASGCRVWTTDGRELIDFVSGFGSIFLGYGFPAITARQQEALALGTGFNATSSFEIEAAASLIELFPHHEMVRFSVTGSEATTAAITLARSVTGRNGIVVFKDHYHGWHGPTKEKRADWTAARRSNDESSQLYELPHNDPETCARFLKSHGSSIACVIFEIVMGSGAHRLSDEMISVLNAARSEHGILLIADEVLTGFRVALRGAQSVFQVEPDISVFAKALGGGLPMSAIAGSKKHMMRFGDGRAMHGGTSNGNALTTASAGAMLEYLRRNEQAVYSQVYEAADRLKKGILEGAREGGLDCEVRGPGPFFCVELRNRASRSVYETFQDKLLVRGVRTPPGGRWFVGYSHRQSDIDQVLDAVSRAMSEVAAAR